MNHFCKIVAVTDNNIADKSVIHHVMSHGNSLNVRETHARKRISCFVQMYVSTNHLMNSNEKKRNENHSANQLQSPTLPWHTKSRICDRMGVCWDERKSANISDTPSSRILWLPSSSIANPICHPHRRWRNSNETQQNGCDVQNENKQMSELWEKCHTIYRQQYYYIIAVYSYSTIYRMYYHLCEVLD